MIENVGRYPLGRPSEFGAQAIDSFQSPHLADGIHLRIAPSSQVGLPAQPFQVYRFNAGRGSNYDHVRQDIEWKDSNGKVLIPPFDVEPNNSVEGRLPPPSQAVCCWIDVLVPGLTIFDLIFRIFALILRLLFRITLAPPNSLRVDAMITTETGPAMIASRSSVPYQLTATPIECVKVTGKGRVNGVRWIDANDLLEETARRQNLQEGDPNRIELWHLLALPVPDAAHYQGSPPNPLDDANERAKRGAPKRFGLHDEPGVSGPAASPPATPDDELTRLDDFTGKLLEYVTDIVESDDPESITETIVIDTNDQPGLFEMPLLDAVLQTLVEPGVARWLGFADVDDNPLSTVQNDLLVYVFTGAWEVPDSIEGGTRTQLNSTVTCAVVKRPPDVPSPTQIAEPVPGPWLPAIPPSARRIIRLKVSGIVPGAGLAFARRSSGLLESLNKRAPSGRAQPLLPNEPDDAVSAGTGDIVDRTAPPDQTTYRIGQHDWFGRWSEWAKRIAPAGIRPLPPRPVLHAVYTPASVPTPMPFGPLNGTISVQVPVPPVSSLSPGSHLIARLELTVDGTVSNIEIADPANPTAVLDDDIDGPPIEWAGELNVTITARWIDEADRASLPSDPRELRLLDPRPAPQVVLITGLQYTSRPDAMGQARYVVNWTTTPQQASFRVFYTDELRLLRRLQDIADAGGQDAVRASTALSDIEAADNELDRSLVFSREAELFGRDLFEQITTEPVANPGAGDALNFEHSVSGDLQVLSFYRVVSITIAQVESQFNEAPIVAVRVPNTLVSNRPVLTLNPEYDEDENEFRANLLVTVPAGNVPADQYRLRRAFGGKLDPNAMPVITTNAVDTPANGPQIARFEDKGERAAAGMLLPWRRYVWQAEVRGASESGGGPSAEWSPPSAPVAHTFVPPSPPPPPNLTLLEENGVELRLFFTHPEALDGGAVGNYTFEVYRQPPDGLARLAGSVSANNIHTDGGGIEPNGFRFVDSEIPPIGTAYSVLVRDPIGRASASSDTFISTGAL